MISFKKFNLLLLFAVLILAASSGQYMGEIVLIDPTLEPGEVEVNNMYPTNIDAMELLYPSSITTISDGSTGTFNKDAEICAFINGC